MKIQKKAEASPEVDVIGAPISAAAIKAIQTDSAQSLLDDFDDEFIVHAVEIEGREFLIRELDIMSLIDVETQRLTVERGQIVRRPNREAKLGLSLEFSATLMCRNGDSYEPLFDLETVQKFLAKPRARSLINRLAVEIYRINPELAPANKVRAAKAVNS